MEKTVRHVSKELYVPLTPIEREDTLKDMLADLEAMEQCQDKIEQLKAAEKLQKENIDVMTEHVSDARFKIKHGLLRQVPCKVILDWEGRSVITIRKDTYEVIDQREMNANDKPEITDEQYETEAADVVESVKRDT